jgi:hypothetical protein
VLVLFVTFHRNLTKLYLLFAGNPAQGAEILLDRIQRLGRGGEIKKRRHGINVSRCTPKIYFILLRVSGFGQVMEKEFMQSLQTQPGHRSNIPIQKYLCKSIF